MREMKARALAVVIRFMPLGEYATLAVLFVKPLGIAHLPERGQLITPMERDTKLHLFHVWSRLSYAAYC